MWGSRGDKSAIWNWRNLEVTLVHERVWSLTCDTVDYYRLSGIINFVRFGRAANRFRSPHRVKSSDWAIVLFRFFECRFLPIIIDYRSAGFHANDFIHAYRFFPPSGVNQRGGTLTHTSIKARHRSEIAERHSASKVTRSVETKVPLVLLLSPALRRIYSDTRGVEK